MGMGKIKALKIRSIGFFAPDFLHVAFLGFSAKKRLRQKLKVMSEILSVPASRNNFAKKDRIDYSCGGAACFWCCVICPEDADLAFIPAEVRLAITIKSMMMDTIIRISWTEQHLILYEGENETYIEASVENSSSILYDKEIRNKPRTRRTKRNV